MYGKKDLRLEEFDLPAIKDDEILIKIISDSLCTSTYKAAELGTEHKRVPENISSEPVIVGHEFCGEVVEVGAKWKSEWSAGEKFAIQPAINYKGSLAAPGYSYKYLGGGATYAIVPNEFMECGCLLHYEGAAFFFGSLAEPMSCIVGAFNASYHTDAGSYVHKMGIKKGGAAAILSGAGPMGLGAVDYALNGPVRPSSIVVTDIDEARLRRASELFPESDGSNGASLRYVNLTENNDAANYLKTYAPDGFDDVFVFAPFAWLVELADAILGRDGCLNFFAGPTDAEFSAKMNFYNVHYASTHIVGTSGGNTDDMKESLALMESGRINPASMITHVGGLDTVVGATLGLPKIPGGKKLIYTHIEMPLTPLADLSGSVDARFRELGAIVEKNNDLWCAEAEAFLLGNFK